MKTVYVPTKSFLFPLVMVLLITGVSKAQPGKVWEFQTDSRVFSSAQVVDGLVIIGSDDHYLYALNAETGEEVWKFDANAKVRSTAVIHDNIIVISSGSRLYGLEQSSGEVLWKHEPEEIVGLDPFNNVGRWDFHDSSPIMKDSIAYYGNDYGTIYGVNIYSGIQTYRFKTEAGTAIRTKPSVAGDTLYFADWDGNVYATRISDSELVWESEAITNFGPPFYGQVTTDIEKDGDFLFYGGHLEIVNAVNRLTGTVQEAFQGGGSGWISGFPAIINEHVIIGGSDYHNIISFDKNDFSVNWIYGLSSKERVFSKPFLMDTLVATAIGGGGDVDTLDQGSILFLEESTSNPVAQIIVEEEMGVGHGIMNTPFNDKGDLYFGTYGGKVIKVNFDDHMNSLFREVKIDTGIIDFGELRLRSTGYRGRVKRVGITNNGDGFEYFSLINSKDSILTLTDDKEYFEPGELGYIYVDITLPEGTEPGFYETELNLLFKSFPDSIFTKKVKYSIENDLITYTENEDSPIEYVLSQNYPNPFNPTTKINYSIASPGYTTLKVFDTLGREIVTLVDEHKTSGHYSVNFQASRLSSGVYFYILTSNNFSQTQRMVMIK
ncbi:MAG: hypothetical protein BalsKO_00740 [Balneolaceae bacterium]